MNRRSERFIDKPLTIRVDRSWIRFETITCFAIPIFTLVRLPLVGTLLASDLILFALIPFIMLNSGYFNINQKFLNRIFVFLGLWFLASVVSDIRAQTSFIDLLRWQAAFWTLAGYIFVFFVLIDGRRERYVAALVGIALANILKNLLGISVFGAGGFFGVAWKFGNGVAVTILLLVLLQSRLRTRKAQGMFTVGFSLVDLALNARSLFLKTFLAGFAAMVGVKGLSPMRRNLVGLLVVAVGLLALPLAEAVYGNAVMSGYFGQDVKEKYIDQSQKDMGALLGGRSESLIAIEAISQKPLLGFGSYAKDADLRLKYLQTLEQSGEDIDWNGRFVTVNELIPTHSYFFSAFVNHGVLGGLFWAYIMTLVLRGVFAGMFGYRPCGPLELLPLMMTIWDIMFSPFGLTQRVFTPIYIVIACILIENNIRPNRNINK
ncbi:UNVERIFIED_ORG: hypothetical protein BCL66_108136 [Martelella mediterranea]